MRYTAKRPNIKTNFTENAVMYKHSDVYCEDDTVPLGGKGRSSKLRDFYPCSFAFALHEILYSSHSLPQNINTPRYLSTLSRLFLSNRAEVNLLAVLTHCCHKATCVEPLEKSTHPVMACLISLTSSQSFLSSLTSLIYCMLWPTAYWSLWSSLAW